MQKQFLTRRKFVKVAAVAGGTAAMGGLVACAADGGAPSAGSQAASASASSGEQETVVSSSAEIQQDATTGSEISSAASSGDAEDVATEGEAVEDEATENETEAAMSENNALVLIYSRADENYNVGYIETGNTMVLAQFIQQKTGADLFELKPATPYPADYQACIDQALAEQDRGDRPAIAELPDLSAYNTVYFGFPVWWGDIPMPVYTAIEALDWQGKTIAPFNTHEGSGSAGMFGTLARVCVGSTVLDGLTVQGSTAQNQRDVAEQRVDEWLEGLGL